MLRRKPNSGPTARWRRWPRNGSATARACLADHSQTENLAGVHDVERIERALDRAHGLERRCAIFWDGRYFILPRPIPCSPVQVPSIAKARSVRRSREGAHAPRDLLGISSCRPRGRHEGAITDMTNDRGQKACSRQCRAPSRRGIRRAAKSARTTSVASGSVFGRKPRCAQYASCRACQSRERSSALVAQSNGPPPNSRRDLAEAL